jgi:hypothetical protein
MEGFGMATGGGNGQEWECGFCHNKNYSHRTHCNKRNCGRAKEDTLHMLMYGVPPIANPLGNPLGNPLSMPPMGGMGMMGMGMGAGGGVKRNRNDPRDGPTWRCPECGNENFAARNVCNMRKCKAARPAETMTWKCTECGNENYPARTHCNMRKCKAPRDPAGATKKSKVDEESTPQETTNTEEAETAQ